MNDLDIRTELRKNHFAFLYSDPNTKIVEELGLAQGKNKIDIAIINGSLIGIEIKSEQDTLDRLPSQIETYNKIFDFLYLVTNEKHVDKVNNMIPIHWGLMCVIKAKESAKIDLRRIAEKNPLIDSNYLVQLLWKNEAHDLLEKHDLIKGMRSKNRQEIWQKIADNIPQPNLNMYVREYLKKREKWRSKDLRLLVNGD